jgi:hypothetical protein
MRVKKHIDDPMMYDKASENLDNELNNATIPNSNRFSESKDDQEGHCVVTDEKKKPCPGLTE